MIKRLTLIISIIIIAVSFTSCKGSSNLNDLAIVQAIGIDYGNNGYSVYLQVLDINKGIGTNEGVKGNITAVIKGEGSEIISAIASIEKTISEKLFFGQNKLIIIGNSIDINDVEIIGVMSDGVYVRPDVYVVKSTETAEKIINNKQGGSRVPSENICRQMKKEKCVFTVNDFLNGLKKNDLPVIEAAGDCTVFPNNRRN